VLQLSGLSLDSVSSPLFKLLSDVSVCSPRLLLRQSQPDQPHEVEMAEIELLKEKAKIGPLTLSGIRLTITYENPGAEKHEAEANHTRIKSRIEATIEHTSVTAIMQHNSADEFIHVRLHPTSNGAPLSASVADICDNLLPMKLPSFLSNIRFLGADISLCTSDFSVQNAKVDLEPSESLRIGQLAIACPQVIFDGATAVFSRIPSDTPHQPEGLASNNTDVKSVKLAGYIGTSEHTEPAGGLPQKDVRIVIDLPTPTKASTETLGFTFSSMTNEKIPVVDLLKTLGLRLGALELPFEGTFFGISSASGLLCHEASSATVFLALQQLDIAAESANSMTLTRPIPAFSSKTLALENFRLNAHFEKGSSLKTQIEACLKIAGHDIWMAFSKQGDYEMYDGEIATSGMAMDQLIGALTPTSPVSLVNQFDAWFSSPLEKLQIKCRKGAGVTRLDLIGRSTSVVELQCSGVCLKLLDVGVEVTVVDISAEGSPSVDMSLTGSLIIPGFLGAQVRLRIAPDDAVLTAVLKPASDAAGKGLELIADFVSGPGNSSWSSVVPTTSKPMGFDGSGVALRVDFAASKITAIGVVEGIGEAVLVSKPTADGAKQGYFASLTAHDLGTLWSSGGQNLSSFNISNLAVEILTFETTVKELLEETRLLTKEVTVKVPNSNAVSPCSLLPPTTPLTPGAWFFATVTPEGPSEMTKAFKLAMDPNSKPAISIYACVPRDANAAVYSVDLRNFVLLGGKITLNGKGTYTPADKALRVDATLTLNGLTEQPIDFDVLLEVMSGKVSFNTKEPSEHALTNGTTEIAHKKQQSIGKLFNGKMFNIELVAPKFHGLSTTENGRTVHTQKLTGGIQLGEGQVDPSVLGSVIFDTGKPEIAALEFKRPLSVEELITKIVAPRAKDASDQAATGLPALSLENTKLYYSPGKERRVLEGIDYLPGYHLQGRLNFFDRMFDVMVDIPESQNGIVLSGSYGDVIDLGFAQISSPALRVDTTGPKVVSLVILLGCLNQG
jgi:stress-induced morphogen